MLKIVGVFIIMFVLSSCVEVSFRDDKGDKIVAIVGDDKLFISQIVGLDNPNVSSDDSMRIINDHATIWMRKTVVDNYSELKYGDKDAEIEKLVDEYRSSLYTNRLEKEYVMSVSDTVTKEEMDMYYALNKFEFMLSAPVVKAKLVVVPINYNYITMIKRKFRSNRKKEANDILQMAKRDNLVTSDFSQTWVYLNKVAGYLPFSEDLIRQLKEGEVYEKKDDNYRYLIKIIDYKLEGDIAPKDISYDMIRQSIIIKRQRDKIIEIKDSIYNATLESGVAVIKMN